MKLGGRLVRAGNVFLPHRLLLGLSQKSRIKVVENAKWWQNFAIAETLTLGKIVTSCVEFH